MNKIVFLCGIYLLFSASLAVSSDYRFGLGAGLFDSLDNANTFTGSLIVEGNPISALLGLRPTGQLLVISDSGYYIGLGLLKEFHLNSSWSYGVGFSMGGAHESNESEAIDYDVEFYSRMVVSRRLNQGDSLRLEFGHISNGGLDDNSPGSEPMMLFWVHNFEKRCKRAERDIQALAVVLEANNRREMLQELFARDYRAVFSTARSVCTDERFLFGSSTHP